ncbi:unnamed protein product [Clonostachys rosea]|uniref:Uncharacterized protein n=1 Tax=Bionectria ochroleuca TaxID=29856 RepID=A0ABY6U7F1_BIOOC|nr:unnamed protein product [Clonostachys rosea]
MASNFISVPVFLVIFRETLETAIIVSVLLAFLKQTLGGPDQDAAIYRSLCKQVWLGTAVGFLICLAIAGTIVSIFYIYGRDAWAAHEYYYEGAFSLFAAVVISVMGVALLRVGQMQDKWRNKLAKALQAPIQADSGKTWLKRLAEKYALFFLPFITILREGIEGIVFVAGLSFSAPPAAIPFSALAGLAFGVAVGYAIFKGGSVMQIRLFLVISTCFLYLVAAGLFSRSIWYFETQEWNIIVGGDAAELGDGPGSYDIDRSLWHVNCCSPEVNGGGIWAVLNAVLGWTNSATYGSVIAYNAYWVCVMVGLVTLRFRERNGRLPFMKAKKAAPNADRGTEREAAPLLDGGAE